MKTLQSIVGRWLGIVVVVAGSSLAAGAQEGATSRTVVAVSPPVPVQKSPVDYFRQLLASQGDERERLMAGRTEGQREQFRAFIREYEQCSPEERERRLQALELRFQITSILRLPPEARAQQVDRLPEPSRRVVKERLDYWNQLSPDVQTALLENERLMRVISYVSAGRSPTPGVGGSFDSGQLGTVEKAILNWNSLPESKRFAAEQAFKRMFEVGSVAAAPAVAPLGPAERDEMQQVLDRFKNLSPAQRSLCVRNFSKLADMSADERQAFLRSAEEWARMNPDDRQAWRNLVKQSQVFPPFPPGFRTPPLPWRVPRMTPAGQVTTNGG